MKFLPLVACALLTFAFPACSSMGKKKACPSGGGSCCAAKAHQHKK